jgi:type IV pilus assembly protein PilA
MNKLKTKKGFTLMEMLIVVAIIAILVAIAVPVFNSQLTKAREQVDAANVRTATSLAVADYMLYERSGENTYTFNSATGDSMVINYGADDAAGNPTLAADGSFKSKVSDSLELIVVINDGAVTTAHWT